MAILKTKAKEGGVTLKVDYSCCHRPNCYTCLGRYHLHFPYISVLRNNKWKYIRVRELTSLFSAHGLYSEEINTLKRASDLRVALLKIYFYLAVLLRKMELVDWEI